MFYLTAPPSLHNSRPLLSAVPSPYLPRSLPPRPRSCNNSRYRARCGLFRNCDLTNSFSSLITHRHQPSYTSSHHTHTSHRISGIVRRDARIKLSLMDSSAGRTCAALVTSSFLVALVAYALTPLSWAFCRLRNNATPIACSPPVHIHTRCFRKCCFLHPCPPSVPIVFLHLSFPVVTVVWNLPHSFLPVLSFWCRYLFDPSFYPHRQLLNHLFNFYLHACGSSHLGLANFLLVLPLRVPEQAVFYRRSSL